MELLGTPEKFYDIEKVSERKIEKFNTTASYYKISVKGLEVKGLPEILKTFKKLFSVHFGPYCGEHSITGSCRDFNG